MGAASSLATLGLNFALARQAEKAKAKATDRDRDRQIAGIKRRDAEAQRQADADLKRRLASSRARAGAAGLTSSGSAGAVLRGLTEESKAIQAARQRESALRIDGLRQSSGGGLLDFSASFARRGLSRGGSRSLLGS